MLPGGRTLILFILENGTWRLCACACMTHSAHSLIQSTEFIRARAKWSNRCMEGHTIAMWLPNVTSLVPGAGSLSEALWTEGHILPLTRVLSHFYEGRNSLSSSHFSQAGKLHKLYLDSRNHFLSCGVSLHRWKEMEKAMFYFCVSVLR